MDEYRKKCDTDKLPFVLVSKFISIAVGKVAMVRLDMHSTGQSLNSETRERLLAYLLKMSAPGATIRVSAASISSSAVLEARTSTVASSLFEAAMNEENRIADLPHIKKSRERVFQIQTDGSVKEWKI